MIRIPIRSRVLLGLGLAALIAACGGAGKPTVKLSTSATALDDGQEITLSATVTGNAAKVEFFKGTDKVGEDTSAPYELKHTVTSNDDATLLFTAKATAADNQFGLSEPVSVSVKVDKTAPTVSLAANKSSLNAAGAVTLTATASDNKGVVKVEFFKGTEKLGEDTTPADGFSKVVNLSAEDNGSLKYSAKAYDQKGNMAQSAEVTVSVDIDITKPSIALSRTPEGNVTAAGSITLTATATDDKGIAKVEFFKSGNTTPIATDTDGTDGYKHTLSYTAADNGTHTYTAKVTDTSANVAESAALSVTVDIRGSLSVTIGGLPGMANLQQVGSQSLNITPNVNVTGPDSYAQNLTASTTLDNLKPGSYTITPVTVSTSGSLYSYGAPSSTVEVMGESTASGTVTYAAVTGALTVSIAGLPAGQNVSITGPNGFSQNLTDTTTLKTLAPGSYTIAAPDVSGYTKTLSGSPAAVTAGNTASANVSYKVNVVGLWVANNANNSVVKFSPADLTGSGSVDLSEAKTISGFDGPDSVAFDASGNLWVSNIGPGFGDTAGTTIVKFNASDLTGSGTATPAKTITGLNLPDGLAFDGSGNLWVANYGADTVLRYNASDLEGSGSATPAKTISLTGPSGLAFDASGNLWVTTYADNTVVKFNASDLSGTADATPAKTITGLDLPWGLAFDASGNLWVANYAESGTIFKYNASDLSGSGSATPAKTITGLNSPVGLAFDASGNLWVTNKGDETVLRYNASDLAGSGSATPAMTITGMNSPAGIAFNPTPANLPIQGYRP